MRMTESKGAGGMKDEQLSAHYNKICISFAFGSWVDLLNFCREI